MDVFIPDNAAGWVVAAVIVVALVWWLLHTVPRKLFRVTVRWHARRRGWLLKLRAEDASDRAAADNSARAASWERRWTPGTDIEILGLHRGHVFHARQKVTKYNRRNAANPGVPTPALHYAYVISITAEQPPVARDSAEQRDPALDWYAVLAETEHNISQRLIPRKLTDHGLPKGPLRKSGVCSAYEKDGKLSKRSLLRTLDELVTAVERKGTV